MKTWVIVVIVFIGGYFTLTIATTIGALVYFGVGDPSRLVPEKCAADPPLSCSGSAVTEEGVSMFLQNNDSRVMRVKAITVLSNALDDCSWAASGGSYPELESGNTPIVYILASSGAFIPKSAKGPDGTRVTNDNNFNFGAAGLCRKLHPIIQHAV